MTIEGFLPVIINIAPVNVQLLLGLADENEPFDPAKDEGPERLSYFKPIEPLTLQSSPGIRG